MLFLRGRLEEIVLFNGRIQGVMNSGAAVVQADNPSNGSLRFNGFTFFCGFLTIDLM